MGERILSLLGLFDLLERFVLDENSKNLDYINNLSQIDYSKDFAKFNAIKQKSMDFLFRNV